MELNSALYLTSVM